MNKKFLKILIGLTFSLLVLVGGYIAYNFDFIHYGVNTYLSDAKTLKYNGYGQFSLGKSRLVLTGDVESGQLLSQKYAFYEKYKDKHDINKLGLVVGKIEMILPNLRAVKISLNGHSGWVKIDSDWQGNYLKWKDNDYFEIKSYDSIDNFKLFRDMRKADYISLICSDLDCEKSISGHIYEN